MNELEHNAVCPYRPDPGFVDVRIFEQGLWWVDRYAMAHRISDMDVSYVANLLLHLEEHAERYFWAVLSDVVEDVADFVVSTGQCPEIAALIAALDLCSAGSAREWLLGTPLHNALLCRWIESRPTSL